MTTTIRHIARWPGLRISSVAAVVAMSLALLAPSVAVGAPSARASLSGDTLTVRVEGGERVGMWRVRVVAPGRSERVEIVLRSGDISWNALVLTSKRTPGGWKVVSRKRVAGSYDGLRRASGRGAGITWDTRDFRLPQDGDGVFLVKVNLLRDGRYRAGGAIRRSVEAFTYGPWRHLGGAAVSH